MKNPNREAVSELEALPNLGKAIGSEYGDILHKNENKF